MQKIEKTIIRAKNGDQKAFKYLFDVHIDMVYRFLRKFENDHDLVEDWTQRAFIKAFNKIEQYNGLSKFSSWVIAIALNEMKTDFRKKSFNSNISLEDYPLREIELVGLEDFEWRHDMNIVFNELSEDNKAILILYEVEGFSHSEIAETLKISEAKSRTTLCRTKKYLKNIIVKTGMCYD